MTDEVIGYEANGKPIHSPKKGFVYTAAFILCSKCMAPISGMGGPRFGALCLKCHDENKKQE
jgi:hypothetical protein